jgi:hypothetical protein
METIQLKISAAQRHLKPLPECYELSPLGLERAVWPPALGGYSDPLDYEHCLVIDSIFFVNSF